MFFCTALVLSGCNNPSSDLASGIPQVSQTPSSQPISISNAYQLKYKVDMSGIPLVDQNNTATSLRNIIDKRIRQLVSADANVSVSQSNDSYYILASFSKDPQMSTKTINSIGLTVILNFKEQRKDWSGDEKQTNDGWVDSGLSGRHLVHANAEPNSSGNDFVINLRFNSEGKRLLADITRRNIGKSVALFLDDELISQPSIDAAITNGVAMISGKFNATQALQFVDILNNGVLPAPIVLLP